MSIRAITFDVWDTILVDNSDDELRLKSLGETKEEARIRLYQDYLSSFKDIDFNMAQNAIELMELEFYRNWKESYKTWSVYSRIEFLHERCRVDRTEISELKLKNLIKKLEEMELEFPIKIAAGIEECLEKLFRDFKLGIISDTIYSPGKVIRNILDKNNLLRYFSTFSFSDEVGVSKPHEKIFQDTVKKMGVKPCEIVHIGDRFMNDIFGAQQVGSLGVYCEVIKRRPLTSDQVANYRFDKYDHLIRLIENIQMEQSNE